MKFISFNSTIYAKNLTNNKGLIVKNNFYDFKIGNNKASSLNKLIK